MRQTSTERQVQTWCSYRVNFKDAPDAVLDLGEFGIIEAKVPYYGYKDKLTDERGVFNVAKAKRIALGEDPEAVLGEDSGNAQAKWQMLWAYSASLVWRICVKTAWGGQ